MNEILRSNDLVLISFVEAILNGEGVTYLVADRHMSALEGSIAMFARRVLVEPTHEYRARRALEDAGLGTELRPKVDARER